MTESPDILKSFVPLAFVVLFMTPYFATDYPNSALEKEIKVTLIAPEPDAGVASEEMLVEGLVDDLSVSEIKLLINSQQVQFVPVNKGYFSRSVNFSERDNLLTIYGANSNRKIFRFEFKITNHSKREKTLEEKIAPSIKVTSLIENEFNILSPQDFQNLKVEAWDNKNDIVQLAYIIDNQAPTYLSRTKRFVDLNIQSDLTNQSSSTLIVFAIDGDGNKTLKRYHFRLENLRCTLSAAPLYGIFEDTPVNFEALIQGGQGKIEKYFQLLDERGSQINHRTMNSVSSISLSDQKQRANYQASLTIKDENGIKASCNAPQILQFYPKNFPLNFQILPDTKLQSVRQNLFLSIEPPILQGEVNVLLKAHDSENGYLTENWKVLGREVLKSKNLRRFWKVKLNRRVPPGSYLMKLSIATDSSDLIFTDKSRIEVSRSTDDTQDLLQEILRGE